MSAISNFLTFLRSAIYAIDVRDGIADAIEQCYNDVNNPTLKTEALEAALQTKIDEGEMAALTIGDHTITAAKLAQGVIDNTLATSGAAADAKKTGDEIAAVKTDLDALEPGLSAEAKAALLACFAHVAWSGTGGRTYYNALINALYPEGNLINGIELTWNYGFINANGELDQLAGYNGSFTSDYFDVHNFSNYQIVVPSEDWNTRRIAFFTATHEFISRVLNENGEIPSNAVYARCTVGNSQLQGQGEYDGAGTSISLT